MNASNRKATVTDKQLLTAFNNAESVIDGLHQVCMLFANAHGEAQAVAPYPKIWGVSRISDNSKALLLCLDGNPSDDELRAIHDALAAPVAQALPAPCNHIYEAKPLPGSSDHRGPWMSVCKYCTNSPSHIDVLEAAETTQIFGSKGAVNV